MKLTPNALKHLVRTIAQTHAEEIGCDECWDHLDQFVDLVLTGKDAEEALPLVQEHLVLCIECREEYQALISALQGMERDFPAAS
jgi:predicted anti-sigma-YlaC factor YlaD